MAAETNEELAVRVAAVMPWPRHERMAHRGDHGWLDDPGNYPHFTMGEDGALMLWAGPGLIGQRWEPAVNMGQALVVVKVMVARPDGLQFRLDYRAGPMVIAQFYRGLSFGGPQWASEDPEVERAICIAALRVCGRF